MIHLSLYAAYGRCVVRRRNQNGAEIRIGRPRRPGDLLKLAIAGCNAMSSMPAWRPAWAMTSKQFVGVSGDYDQQNDRFTHVDVELVHLPCPTRRSRISSVAPMRNQRNCTIEHSIGRRPGALPASHVDERADQLVSAVDRQYEPAGAH